MVGAPSVTRITVLLNLLPSGENRPPFPPCKEEYKQSTLEFFWIENLPGVATLGIR